MGGGWGAGLGIWRGLKGSLVGAREFLGHLRAYLGSYRREEAVMYAPLLEVRWDGGGRGVVQSSSSSSETRFGLCVAFVGVGYDVRAAGG